MKARFLSSLDVRASMDGTWTTLSPLRVELCPAEEMAVPSPLESHKNVVLSVPAWFSTDLASVPRLFWNILPPFGAYEEAAVIHDWLYRHAGAVSVRVGVRHLNMRFSREEADAVLLAGMIACEVPAWQRFVIHRAVRLCGASSFRASLPPPTTLAA